jgi:D-amino-acid dehydrogenase
VRVAVVGGGVVGTSIALELVRCGFEVVVLERDEAVGGGASPGSAGYLCPSHSAPLASPAALRDGMKFLFEKGSPLRIRPRPAVLPWLARFVASCTRGRAQRGTDLLRSLAVESLELHAGLASSGVDTAFERRGILNVYETGPGLALGRHEADRAREAGLAVEALDADAVRDLEPAVRGEIAGAVLYPDEAHCDPAQYSRALADAAAAQGAEVLTGTEVVGLRRAGSNVTHAETTHGVVEADAFVLAAGVWTSDVGRAAGLRLRLEGGKGYHVDFARSDGQPARPVFLQEARVTATPFADRFRLTGMLDLCGRDMSIDSGALEAIETAGRRAFGPEALGERMAVWRGLRPCLPDGLPAVGRAPGAANVVVATGHAMLGLTLGPVTGVLVREILSAAPPRPELDLLRPDRR